MAFSAIKISERSLILLFQNIELVDCMAFVRLAGTDNRAWKRWNVRTVLEVAGFETDSASALISDVVLACVATVQAVA